jgi:hypothetical protein
VVAEAGRRVGEAPRRGGGSERKVGRRLRRSDVWAADGRCGAASGAREGGIRQTVWLRRRHRRLKFPRRVGRRSRCSSRIVFIRLVCQITVPNGVSDAFPVQRACSTSVCPVRFFDFGKSGMVYSSPLRTVLIRAPCALLNGSPI